jgi:hypothetical protein
MNMTRDHRQWVEGGSIRVQLKVSGSQDCDYENFCLLEVTSCSLIDCYQLLEETAASIFMIEESSMATFLNQWDMKFSGLLGGI